MNAHSLRAALRELPLGGLRFYRTTGSTNDAALVWAAAGAPDLSLVVAAGQTRGRGRGGRSWLAAPGASLTFSLILRPPPAGTDILPRHSALGALAAAQALEELALAPQIKWPNDVLLNRRKVCGVLTEAVWQGDQIESVVVGIGLNVGAGSVPPPERLDFPATSLESEAGYPPDRLALLRGVLSALLEWRPRLGAEAFLQAWEARLAFREETVEVWTEGAPGRSGRVLGLAPDGGLHLEGADGRPFVVHFGEARLRPVI